MGTPHIHAKVIKAWADGAKIQWYNSAIDRWSDIVTPSWNINYKYRIKPEPKKFNLDSLKIYLDACIVGQTHGNALPLQ